MVLPHQKHDSHSILEEKGTDQLSIRINDQRNDIIVKPLNSFSFISETPFQTKFKTPVKKNNESLHQQFLLLNDTDITSDDEELIHTRIPKQDSSFTTEVTRRNLTRRNLFNHDKSKSTTTQDIISAFDEQTNSQPTTPC